MYTVETGRIRKNRSKAVFKLNNNEALCFCSVLCRRQNSFTKRGMHGGNDLHLNRLRGWREVTCLSI